MAQAEKAGDRSVSERRHFPYRDRTVRPVVRQSFHKFTPSGQQSKRNERSCRFPFGFLGGVAIRLALKWRIEFRPELKAEGYSRLTYQLEKEGKSVKLTVIHEMEKEGSKFIEAVSSGWPHILASLKSLLETGESLEETREWPRETCK